jgi:hypothetical protein
MSYSLRKGVTFLSIITLPLTRKAQPEDNTKNRLVVGAGVAYWSAYTIRTSYSCLSLVYPKIAVNGGVVETGKLLSN